MTSPQSSLSIEPMWVLAEVSRASYAGSGANRRRAKKRWPGAMCSSAWPLAIATAATGDSPPLCGATARPSTTSASCPLMRTDNLLCLRRRAFVPATTDSRHGGRVVPNLARGLVLTGWNQLWVADLTSVRLWQEFAFLAVVLDAFSRRVVGGAVDVHPRASLALAALRMARAGRRPRPGRLIHHSDRGMQYACGEYSALLEAHEIQPSMSRIGSPYGNAKAERFMKTLKHEEVDGRAYRDAEEARGLIGTFLEEVYNRQRLHSALAYLAPAEFEATLRPAAIPMLAAIAERA
jgi:putative transposase